MSTTSDSIHVMGAQIGTALCNAIEIAKERAAQRRRWTTYAQYFRAIGQPATAAVFESQLSIPLNPAHRQPAVPAPTVQPAVAQPAAAPAPKPTPKPTTPAFDVSTATPADIATYADALHGDLALFVNRIAKPAPAKSDIDRAQELHRQGQQLYADVSVRAEKSQDHAVVQALFGYQMRRLGNALPGYHWQIELAKARVQPEG